MTRDFTAFGGCVIFHMTPRQTIRFGIALDELMRTFPEFIETNSAGRLVFKNSRGANDLAAFAWCFGFTKDITFKLNADSDPVLHEFQDWWRKHARPSNWRQLFEDYQLVATDDLATVWYQAYMDTRPPEAVAPEELQDGAEEKAKRDPDFLESATTVSHRSGSRLKVTPGKQLTLNS